ncbi:hypothetical protein Rs2_07912 [Raphanus sativus]|nr:hypothetical protein Rs2_07912 [Raphanus sativus]
MMVYRVVELSTIKTGEIFGVVGSFCETEWLTPKSRLCSHTGVFSGLSSVGLAEPDRIKDVKDLTKNCPCDKKRLVFSHLKTTEKGISSYSASPLCLSPASH